MRSTYFAPEYSATVLAAKMCTNSLEHSIYIIFPYILCMKFVLSTAAEIYISSNDFLMATFNLEIYYSTAFIPKTCFLTNFVQTTFVLTNFVQTTFVLTTFVLTTFVLANFVLTTLVIKTLVIKIIVLKTSVLTTFVL
jgi:hypothetical protein